MTLKDVVKDEFYIQIYEYYYNRGFTPILLTYICEIFSMLFGIMFFYFFISIDWENILKCVDNNCGDISQYIISKPMNFLNICILLLSVTIFTYKIITFIPKIYKLNKIKNFYQNKLKIKHSNELCSLSWSTILRKITKIYNFYDMHDVTNKIMKKENFMIALIDKKIIDFQYPLFYTKQLEINLKYIILSSSNLKSRTLKFKFIAMGFLNLFFAFFIFLFQIIYFIVDNIDDFYSNKYVLGPRRYTILTRHKFRNYNELPHYFENRINKSMKHSIEYVKQFESPVLTVIGKFLSILSGTFICFFVILSVLDESILLYVRYLDRTLLFYMGMVTALSSLSKSFVRSPEESIYDPNGVMKKVVEFTHYMPKRWEGKCNTYEVRNEFLTMFPYKIVIFIYDLISVITTPFILFSLSKDTNSIISFFDKYTVDDVSGKICSFAQKNKDSIDDKMKQSILNFDINHSINDGDENIIDDEIDQEDVIDIYNFLNGDENEELLSSYYN
jgi:autophagy-related protein 9